MEHVSAQLQEIADRYDARVVGDISSENGEPILILESKTRAEAAFYLMSQGRLINFQLPG